MCPRETKEKGWKSFLWGWNHGGKNLQSWGNNPQIPHNGEILTLRAGNTMQLNKPPVWFISHFSVGLEPARSDDMIKRWRPAPIKASSRKSVGEQQPGGSCVLPLVPTLETLPQRDPGQSPEEGYTPQPISAQHQDEDGHRGMECCSTRRMRE